MSLHARSRQRLFSVAGTAAVLASLIALNVLAQFGRARLDFSAGRIYSLAAGTKSLLRELKDTLVIKVYFSRGLPPPFGLNERYLRDLLAEYRAAGRGNVAVEFIDPDRDEAAQQEARQAGVTPVQINVMGRDRFESKEAWMGAVFLYKGKTETLAVVERANDLEFELTRRIKRLLATRPKVVGFLTGHGEKTPEDRQLQPFFGLIREHLEPRTVALSTAAAVPQDLDALWIAGPTTPLKAQEVAALTAWAKTGKTLVVLANTKRADLMGFRVTPADPGLSPLLAPWGLSLADGLVVDAQAEKIQVSGRVGYFATVRIVEYPFVPIATALDASHPATAGLRAVSFPFAQPIRFNAAQAPGTTYMSLASSSKLSWLSSALSIEPGQPFESLVSQDRGPYSLAGVASGPAGRLVVVGTAYQLEPRLGGKGETAAFVLNLLDWSAQDESLLSIRGKGAAHRPLRPLSDAARLLIKYSMLLTLPGLTLAAAAFLWRRRRLHRRALPALYSDA